MPRRCCTKNATGGRIAHPRVKKVQKSGTFCEKLCEKWGPVANGGQAAPASPSPHAGGSHPVGTRLTPPPNSNHRHFHRFPSPAAAPKGPAFGRLEKPGQPPAGLRPAGGWPGFSGRPKSDFGNSAKKCPPFLRKSMNFQWISNGKSMEFDGRPSAEGRRPSAGLRPKAEGLRPAEGRPVVGRITPAGQRPAPSGPPRAMGNDENDFGWSWGAANAVCQRDANFLREEWGSLERSVRCEQRDPTFRTTFRKK